MAGSHICHNTIPYHCSKGVGWVVGFWVDFSLGTCCRIWLGPPIPCILIPDPLHTYKRRLTYFISGGQSYDCVLTPCHHNSLGKVWRWECKFLTCIILLCNDRGPLIHLILIPDLLYTYIKRLTYFIWGGQSYECVLTPLSLQYPWPSLVWGDSNDML